MFDLKHTIDFAGQYQTMTKLAAIYVDVNIENTLARMKPYLSNRLIESGICTQINVYSDQCASDRSRLL